MDREASVQRFQDEVVPILENIYQNNHRITPTPQDRTELSITKIVGTNTETYVCIVKFRHKHDNQFELMFQIRTLSPIVNKYAYNMFKTYNFNDSEFNNRVSTDIQKVFPPNSATPSKPVPGDNSYRLMSHDANLWSAIHRLTLIAERYISH
jgi:hypothetical protein